MSVEGKAFPLASKTSTSSGLVWRSAAFERLTVAVRGARRRRRLVRREAGILAAIGDLLQQLLFFREDLSRLGQGDVFIRQLELSGIVEHEGGVNRGVRICQLLGRKFF